MDCTYVKQFFQHATMSFSLTLASSTCSPQKNNTNPPPPRQPIFQSPKTRLVHVQTASHLHHSNVTTHKNTKLSNLLQPEATRLFLDVSARVQIFCLPDYIAFGKLVRKIWEWGEPRHSLLSCNEMYVPLVGRGREGAGGGEIRLTVMKGSVIADG